jgi:hypothetical protein
MSHIPSHPDQNLLQEKGGEGFPYLVYMDPEGMVLSSFYPRSLPDFESYKAQAQVFLDAKKAHLADPSNEELKIKYYLIALKIQPSEEILETLMALDQAGELSASDSKILKSVLAKKAIESVLQELYSAKDQPSEQEMTQKYGKTFYELYQKGIAPEPELDQGVILYWQLSFGYGFAQKDKAFCQTAYEQINLILHGNPRAQEFLNQLKAKVEELK